MTIIEQNKSGLTGLIMKDPSAAFEDAIAVGKLSDKEFDSNYAGNYMYMYSKNNSDFFKHIDTRDYLIVSRG